MRILTFVVVFAAGVVGAGVEPYYFGPPKARQAPTNRKFTGIPSLCASPKGRLWATWYGGPTPSEDINNYIVLATSSDHGETWKEVAVVDPDEDGPSRCFDANLWVTPDGRLQWNWSERLPGYGGELGEKGDRVFVMYGDDPDSATMNWTSPRQVAEGVAMGKSLRLSTGEWAMPVSKWFDDTSARMLVSADAGETWSVRGGASVPKIARQYDEHQFTECRNGSIVCWMRTLMGMATSRSADRGVTWSPSQLAWIPTARSRFFVRRLASGRLLMVKHGPQETNYAWRPRDREELMAFLSEDDGETWQGGLMLDERQDVSYPDGDQLPDGTICVIHDRERTGAKEILMSRFTEDDVLAGRLVSNDSRLKMLVSRGTSGAMPGGEGYVLDFSHVESGSWRDTRVITDVKIDSKNFTLEAWLYRTGDAAGYKIFAQYPRGTANYALFLGGQDSKSDTLDVFFSGVADLGWWQPGVKVPRNLWTHVAMTKSEAGTVVLYTNGVEAARLTDDRIRDFCPDSPVQQLWLGNTWRDGNAQEGSYGRGFPGYLAEMRCWNVTRTADEIKACWKRRLSGHEAGLVGYWPLNEGDGAQVVNRRTDVASDILGSGVWVLRTDLPFVESSEIPAEPDDPGLIISVR